MSKAQKFLTELNDVNERLESYFMETNIEKPNRPDELMKDSHRVKGFANIGELAIQMARVATLLKVSRKLSDLQKKDTGNPDLKKARSELMMDVEEEVAIFNAYLNDVKRQPKLTTKDILGRTN